MRSRMCTGSRCLCVLLLRCYVECYVLNMPIGRMFFGVFCLLFAAPANVKHSNLPLCGIHSTLGRMVLFRSLDRSVFRKRCAYLYTTNTSANQPIRLTYIYVRLHDVCLIPIAKCSTLLFYHFSFSLLH